MAFIPVSSFIGLRVVNKANTVCQAPPRVGRWTMKGGKGFGGGEATRDPEATKLDPNDPKAKQKAIHPAESFAEYQARLAREKEEKKK